MLRISDFCCWLKSCVGLTILFTSSPYPKIDVFPMKLYVIVILPSSLYCSSPDQRTGCSERRPVLSNALWWSELPQCTSIKDCWLSWGVWLFWVKTISHLVQRYSRQVKSPEEILLPLFRLSLKKNGVRRGRLLWKWLDRDLLLLTGDAQSTMEIALETRQKFLNFFCV